MPFKPKKKPSLTDHLYEVALLAGYPAALPAPNPDDPDTIGYAVTKDFLVLLQVRARQLRISLLEIGNRVRREAVRHERTLFNTYGYEWKRYWNPNLYGPLRPPDYHPLAWGHRSDGGRPETTTPRHCLHHVGGKRPHPFLLRAGEGEGPGQFDLKGFRDLAARKLTNPLSPIRVEDLPGHDTPSPGIPLRIFGLKDPGRYAVNLKNKDRCLPGLKKEWYYGAQTLAYSGD